MQGNGARVSVQGGVEIARFLQGEGAIVMRLGYFGFEAERAVEGGQRPLRPAGFAQGVAEVDQGVGIVRPQPHRLLQQGQCRCRISGLEIGHTEQVQGVEVRGVQGEDLAIPPRGVADTALAVERDALFEEGGGAAGHRACSRCRVGHCRRFA